MFEKFLVYLLCFLVGFICASLLWKTLCDNYIQTIKEYNAIIEKYKQENKNLFYKNFKCELDEIIENSYK